MRSHTIKGADNGLYGEDPAQNPYSTGLPVEYTYIPQEIRWNIAIKINNQKYTREFNFGTWQQVIQMTKQKPNKKKNNKNQTKNL